MPGPLPTANPRRRNQPTIPTTYLPAKGRPGPVPKPPKWVTFGAVGAAWWAWAWRTPQAAAWADGMQVVIARRAFLEDVLASAADTREKLAVAREARELDDRLGLTPKAMAALRWSIAPDEVGDARKERTTKKAGRPRLRAVDPTG